MDAGAFPRGASQVSYLGLSSLKMHNIRVQLEHVFDAGKFGQGKIYQGMLQGISGGHHSARTSNPAAGRTPCRSEFIQMADPRKGSSPPKRPRTEKCRRYIPRRTAANLVNTMFSRS